MTGRDQESAAPHSSGRLLAPGWKRSVEVRPIDGEILARYFLSSHIHGIKPQEFRVAIEIPALREVAKQKMADEANVNVMVSAQERRPDGTWKALGGPVPADSPEARRLRGELGVEGNSFDRVHLAVLHGTMIAHARELGVAVHVWTAQEEGVRNGKMNFDVPRGAYADHKEACKRRLKEAEENANKAVQDALEAKDRAHGHRLGETIAKHREEVEELKAKLATALASSTTAQVALNSVRTTRDELIYANNRLTAMARGLRKRVRALRGELAAARSKKGR